MRRFRPLMCIYEFKIVFMVHFILWLHIYIYIRLLDRMTETIVFIKAKHCSLYEVSKWHCLLQVTTIPWAEDDLASETSVIRDRLINLNKNGILTINSQPNVNCVPSSDKIFGWGSPGGYVFQKVNT